MRLTRRRFLHLSGATALAAWGAPIAARNLDAYLCAESGEYRFAGRRWVRCGCNSPENLLSFSGIRNTPGGVHDFEPHRADFRPIPGLEVPGRLRPIVGALWYLSRYVNAIYVVLYTADGGDDGHVHPWLDLSAKEGFDWEKLDDWELIFRAANAMGIEVQLFFSEKENQWNVLGRWSYFTGLVNRFRHLPLLTWNIGEENDYHPADQRELIQYIHRLDPIHPVAVHMNHNQPEPPNPDALDAVSLQCNINRFDTWAESLAQSGLALFADEQVEGYGGSDDIDRLTRGWRRFMERGGAGFGCYLGSGESGASPPGASDLLVNDFRTIEPLLEAMARLHADVTPPEAADVRSHLLNFVSAPLRLDFTRDAFVDMADGLSPPPSPVRSIQPARTTIETNPSPPSR